MAASKKKASRGEAPQVLMYVGPTVAKLSVIQNVVYDGIPRAAEEAIAETPLIRTLFIPITRYPDAERSIREQDGYLWAAYQAALKYRN